MKHVWVVFFFASCVFLGPDTRGQVAPSASPSPAEQEKAILAVNPSGFRVEQDGTDFWVTFSDGQRGKLPVTLPEDPDEIGNFPDEFHPSPNEEWIWAAHHMGSCLRGTDLFHRAGPGKIERVEEFHEHAWENAVKLGLFAKDFSADGACNMVDFGAWSGDSARVFFRLRGGEHKGEMTRRGLYFNTRIQQFELTDYLRKANDRQSDTIACAEPVAPLPAEPELKKRVDSLDRQLNAKYAEVLAKTAKDRVSVVRDAQRDWVKQRDAGAKFYVSLFPAAERPRRRLQFLADVTAARIDTAPDDWE